MKKELPIVIEDNYIKTECWSFERLSIIQTSDNADAWISSHFELFLDWEFRAHFGSLFKWYHSQYYDDILLTKKIDFINIKESEIVDKIKEILKENMYVYIVTNWNFENHNDPFFHGMMIYGYDDEKKVFFAPIMNNNKVWVRGEIKYQYIEAAHNSVIDFFSKNNRRIMFSTDYQYPMLAYKLRDDYSTEQNVFYALEKIENEINGRVCWGAKLGNEMHLSKGETYYTGISCLLGLEKLLNIYIQDKKNSGDYDLTNTLNQMYEHRNLILLSMNYICQEWGIIDEKVEKCIRTYKDSCINFYSWYHIAIKYEICKDKKILYEVLENIHLTYMLEKDALSEFCKSVKKIYEERGNE